VTEGHGQLSRDRAGSALSDKGPLAGQVGYFRKRFATPEAVDIGIVGHGISILYYRPRDVKEHAAYAPFVALADVEGQHRAIVNWRFEGPIERLLGWPEFVRELQQRTR
jgi:hypothetical protein